MADARCQRSRLSRPEGSEARVEEAGPSYVEGRIMWKKKLDAHDVKLLNMRIHSSKRSWKQLIQIAMAG